MVCSGFEPRAAGWKERTDPLSYGGTHGVPIFISFKSSQNLINIQVRFPKSINCMKFQCNTLMA